MDRVFSGVHSGDDFETHKTFECHKPYCGRDKITEELNSVDLEVNHPRHYTSHPSGIECITITEYMMFNPGNAIKYLWRAGLKDSNPGSENIETKIKDLKKAQWYINQEIERVQRDV